MKLSIYKETPAHLPLKRLHRLFEMVTRREGKARWATSVNLVLTDDAHMRRLNRRYRSSNAATDVLSFNIDSPDEPDGVFGEIYLSVPFVRRQASEFRRGVWDEYTLLFCHGLLHLFGLDHATEADRAAMFKRQSYYLKSVAGRGRS